MLVAVLAVLAAVAVANEPPVPLAALGDESAIRQLAERGEPTARLALVQGSLTPQQARSLQQEIYVLQNAGTWQHKDETYLTSRIAYGPSKRTDMDPKEAAELFVKAEQQRIRNYLARPDLNEQQKQRAQYSLERLNNMQVVNANNRGVALLVTDPRTRTQHVEYGFRGTDWLRADDLKTIGQIAVNSPKIERVDQARDFAAETERLLREQHKVPDGHLGAPRYYGHSQGGFVAEAAAAANRDAHVSSIGAFAPYRAEAGHDPRVFGTDRTQDWQTPVRYVRDLDIVPRTIANLGNHVGMQINMEAHEAKEKNPSKAPAGSFQHAWDQVKRRLQQHTLSYETPWGNEDTGLYDTRGALPRKIDELKEKGHMALESLGDTVNGYVDAGKNLYNRGAQHVSNAAAAVQQHASNLAQGATNLYNRGAQHVSNAAAAVQQGASNLAQGAANAYNAGVQHVSNAAAAVQQHASNLAQGATNLYNRGARHVSNAASVVQQGASNLAQGAANAYNTGVQHVSNAASVVQQGASNLAQGAANTARSGWNSVRNGWNSLWGGDSQPQAQETQQAPPQEVQQQQPRAAQGQEAQSQTSYKPFAADAQQGGANTPNTQQKGGVPAFPQSAKDSSDKKPEQGGTNQMAQHVSNVASTVQQGASNLVQNAANTARAGWNALRNGWNSYTQGGSQGQQNDAGKQAEAESYSAKRRVPGNGQVNAQQQNQAQQKQNQQSQANVKQNQAQQKQNQQTQANVKQNQAQQKQTQQNQNKVPNKTQNAQKQKQVQQNKAGQQRSKGNNKAKNGNKNTQGAIRGQNSQRTQQQNRRGNQQNRNSNQKQKKQQNPKQSDQIRRRRGRGGSRGRGGGSKAANAKNAQKK